MVAAYIDLAEQHAIEERELRMADYALELDRTLSSAGRKVLDGAGTISAAQAKERQSLSTRPVRTRFSQGGKGVS